MLSRKEGQKHRSLPLWAMVLSINLIVLVLPLIGIASLRIFESILYRQTEVKLIAEGAYVQDLYLTALRKVSGSDQLQEPLIRVLPDLRKPTYDKYNPFFPQLDLMKDKALPPAEEGIPPIKLAHPIAVKAGELITPHLVQVQLKNLSGVRVLDTNGIVVASTRSELGLDLSARQEVASALQGGYSSVLRERVVEKSEQALGPIGRTTRVRVFVAIPMLLDNKLFGVVYLSRTGLSVSRELLEARYLIAFAIVIVITIVISLFLSNIVTRPIKNLIGKARRIANGETDVSLAVAGKSSSESRELTEALSKMVEKLEQRVDFIQQFTRNVSHEFKTPLTGIKGSIEILRESWVDMSNEKRMRFLSIIDAEAKRMERLVARLLELTRIESTTPADTNCNLCELLEQVVAKYSETGREIKLNINTEQDCLGRIEPESAETLFVNIIDNAFTHGADRVEVSIAPAPVVEIVDNGPGISEANLPHIFDRFFTTARDSGGTGLGLAIVKAIVNANRGHIEVQSNDKGTSFKISFRSPH